MIAIGLCYVVLARDGAMTSVTSAERMAPALCAGGIIAEFVAGVAGYYAVAAVWPNFYYTPITAGIWAWLGLQAVCIAIYVVGVMCAYGGIKRALHVLTARAPIPLRWHRQCRRSSTGSWRRGLARGKRWLDNVSGRFPRELFCPAQNAASMRRSTSPDTWSARALFQEKDRNTSVALTRRAAMAGVLSLATSVWSRLQIAVLR